jgi:phosphatidylserine decarboxylase
VRIDRAGAPFIAIAAVPMAVSAFLGPPLLTAGLALLPIAITLFFRDPERQPPTGPRLVLSPADGKVMFAGETVAGEGPPGQWRQVTIFLSVFDVHINRAPVAGRVTKVSYVPGTFRAAYHAAAHGNEHSEIWVDTPGGPVVFRQVVGLLARRVVCRIAAGDDLAAGDRIGLMKFGSRMDVFVPMSARLMVERGAHVVAGQTVIAKLAGSQ